MPTREAVGKTVRSRRVNCGLTCLELARRSKLSYSLVNKIECGHLAASDRSLVLIGRTLDCTPADLIAEAASQDQAGIAAVAR